MASRLLHCIFFLILVSLTVFSYFSKSRAMIKDNYLKISEPNSGDLIMSHIGLHNSAAPEVILRKETFENSNGNSSDSSNDMTISNNLNVKAKDLISLIRSRRVDKNTKQNSNKEQNGFTKRLTDSKSILAKKSMGLLSIETDVPVRMPIVRTIYQPGHLNNEIDVERICSRGGLFTKLLVLITSAPRNEAARMSIRQTWMHYGSRRDVGIAFVLGQSTNRVANKAIDLEDFMYRDMIRGHFIDSYNNLTLKTISLLEWADLHCPKANYVLKTDDDMFINVPKLITFINTLKANRTIYGRRAEHWKPIRNKWSKYHIPVSQYGRATFPYFTTGPAYLLTGDIVHALYIRSLNTPFIKLEDVFTTGIVAESLNIPRINVREIANTRTKFEACHIRNRITIHMVRSNEQFDLWKKLLDHTIKCIG